MRVNSIGVVGAGAWGTALAQTLALAGHKITMWAFEPETVRDINELNINRAFLPGIELSPSIHASETLADVCRCDAILLVPPAQKLRAIVTELAPHIRPQTPLIVCAKGIEISTGQLLSAVIKQILPDANLAILSGPSFAADVARGLPAALTLACANEVVGKALVQALGFRQFRLYWSHDVVGVQFGGAFKNVLAIAAGIVDGKALGASAHAALVTRGFHELRRLGRALGADDNTLVGLSGFGDLILTCGSTQSRNMSLGRALGQGKELADILKERAAVTEGIFTAEAVQKIAHQHRVEMPISNAVFEIVTGKTKVDTAIAALLSRPMRAESV